jgi:hypothetical protein
MKPLKEVNLMITKRLISNVKKEHKSNIKDMLWGILWFGWVVAPIVYGILQKKKAGYHDDKSL